MKFVAQYIEQRDIVPSDFNFHLTRLWSVIEALAGKDARLAEWFLQANTVAEARLYPIYEQKALLSPAAKAVLDEQYRNEKGHPKAVGMWNGESVKKDGASIMLIFDNSPMPGDLDITLGEENTTVCRLGDFNAIAQIVSTIASVYMPAYVAAAPRTYSSKRVFDDKPGVGWMLYLPGVITIQQVPEARALIPVHAASKRQTGTIIVSVTDAVFSVDNPEHIEIANRIEIRLVDQHLLPRYVDL
ncbi:immunity 52 family protein [Paraburkholderia bryophila]|uniref:Immunity protein 52 domain-containing protein n=1 Tax=Paraburkholderia bryophila TaxID=420952 RepID=A0A7Y9WET9_9BURK|nr:immunity 52 family protein [Paraburkholderia bryophila]NYH19540.1 hypothetical protein [Paraburkholderia bryophila]